ncbi:hypothetical protein V8F33_010181, partial [Rhypophila sp. PSN 637]
MTFSYMVELDAQRLNDPVNAYIDHKVCILRNRERYDNCVLETVKAEVRQRAENTFLWAAPSCSKSSTQRMELLAMCTGCTLL